MTGHEPPADALIPPGRRRSDFDSAWASRPHPTARSLACPSALKGCGLLPPVQRAWGGASSSIGL